MFILNSIKLVSTLILALLHHKLPAVVPGYTTPEIISKYGYSVETHYVQTEDGYILTLYRIPHGIAKNDLSKKIPVLLGHGLTGSSADFTSVGPDHSISYILADKRYDVWLMNARGNTYSRNHTKLKPDEKPQDRKEFFNFSWHEIGYYDIPATMDYILKETGNKKLHYIGHSQGCASLLVGLSTRLEYHEKIRSVTLLAPAAFMKYQKRFYPVCKHTKTIDTILNFLHIYELPFTSIIRQIIPQLCPVNESNLICKKALAYFIGTSVFEQIDWTNLGLLAANFPANSAIKQFSHYCQLIKNGSNFIAFDYGPKKNLVMYKQATPPPYNLSAITVPTAIFFGSKDVITYPNDVKTLINRLPNVEAYEVPFNHMDFLFSKNVNNILYKKLMKFIKKYN